MNIATNAGPQPQIVPASPSRGVSTCITSPTCENSRSVSFHSASESEWRRSQTTIPSPTATGVLGTVLRWCVPGASMVSYFPNVMPAATETTIFPASNSFTGDKTAST